jgi:hypothetical protein
MAGLLDVFGTGGGESLSLLGMTPEDIKRAQSDAQAQALYALAGRLFQGGKTGQSIAQGLQMGQQAYQQAMKGQMADRLQLAQLQQMKQQQLEAAEAKARQMAVQKLIPQAMRPAVPGMPAQMVEEEGRYLGETPAVAAQPARFDLQAIAPQLMTTPEGLAALANLSKAQEALQPKLVTIEEGKQLGSVQDGRFVPIVQPTTPSGLDNPFLQFTQDQNIPANIRNLAEQYSKSYAKGTLGPVKADERVRQLTDMSQRAQQYQETQAALQQQRAATNLLAQGNQQIQRMMAEAKLEEKQAKAAEKATTKTEAKEQLTAIVDQLKGKYDTLLQEGGIVSTEAGGMQNIGARLSSSAAGRAVGGAVGTKTQEQRQAIEQTRPLLLNLIKNATGMSAQQMNSNAEMQLYLNAATNPTLSYEANMDALKNLDRLFGLGIVADKIEKSVTAPKVPGQSRSGW